MAMNASDDEGILSGQQCPSGEALAEWRSSGQVENGIPSTSPPYWDTDDEEEEGPKPSDLYGKYTWKIDKFSQITKRELRSNPFEVGSYKWYILIYPQGCDVCNHLSLFLCVANHDKLLPGWSHFAQFTIAVVNKDPKKSKYSDTLHRFWKKEHDWGWKKFMELSKVSDGFLDPSDTLIIKAQVQVIREKADRPFRCLDCQYRRELVRVYLTNVEQLCRRFVEDKRSKLGRLIEDKETWASFCGFWMRMDRNTRRCMSRERTDVILKVLVKQFFVEKEVTSTLVMDSLYSGLKSLECQTKPKKGKEKLSLDCDDSPPSIVCVDKDVFALVDDVLNLIERAAIEPLPPKDEKSPQNPQNRTKDGSVGEEFNKDSIERDELRLTELGRRTVELFILAHIFNHKIEVAYQEAVALKRQEELIREEELAAWLAESDQKTKRGTIEKEKKLKKKQAKQKKNNKKGKEKAKEDKLVVTVEESIKEEIQIAEKLEMVEDASDVSDSLDGGGESLNPETEERVAIPIHWQTDTCEPPPPNAAVPVLSAPCERRNSAMDDSSSTCSTDSVPSVVLHKTLPISRSAHRRRNRQLSVATNGGEEAPADDFDNFDDECNLQRMNSFTVKEKPLPSPSRSIQLSKSELKRLDPRGSSSSKAVQPPAMTRPCTAPIMPTVRPVSSMVQTAALSRSMSATGRLGPDPSPSGHSFPHQSYRNAIMGSNSSGLSARFLPPLTERVDVRAPYSYGQWTEDMNPMGCEGAMKGYQGFQLYKPFCNRVKESNSAACSGGLTDEFPHLDIINDLLNEEHGAVKVGRYADPIMNTSQFLNRQYSLPFDSAYGGDVGSCRFERTRSYQECVPPPQRGYSQFDSVGDGPPITYSNGVVPNQWILPTSVGIINPDPDPSIYFPTDYSNLPCAPNTYPFFRPSNGH